jgi:hypothetical protein
LSAGVSVSPSLSKIRPLADGRVRSPLGHQAKHLALTGGEHAQRFGQPGPAHQAGHDARVHDAFARDDTLDRVDEHRHLGHPVLEQVADPAGEGLKEPQRVAGIEILRQDQDRRARVARSHQVGIVADNRTGTVTFHLTRPDPDFLYRLTLAYADVLPATAPGQQAQTPLPATGPYMITRYIPGRELLLIRNPHFREWSAAAQPGGYPDRIVIRLGLTGAQGAATIVDGKGDFMPNIGRIPGSDAAYFLLRHRSQLRINPLMVTGFMFLNVNAPPFNQLRVRRAVNLALGRRQIVNSYGDPLAADVLWARLDREFTDLAIWLPTVTPNETDLISHRFANYQYNPVWGALIDQMWIR